MPSPPPAQVPTEMEIAWCWQSKVTQRCPPDRKESRPRCDSDLLEGNVPWHVADTKWLPAPAPKSGSAACSRRCHVGKKSPNSKTEETDRTDWAVAHWKSNLRRRFDCLMIEGRGTESEGIQNRTVLRQPTTRCEDTD